MIVRRPDEIAVIRWVDNKPVVMASVAHGIDPQDTCSRWLKEQKSQIQVPRPAVVAEYNMNMGGVDMWDCMLSFYRMSSRTRRSGLFAPYFTSLIWPSPTRGFSTDSQALQRAAKNTFQYLEFKLLLAEELMVQSTCLKWLTVQGLSDAECLSATIKHM